MEESVRVSLDMDGSRPEREQEKEGDDLSVNPASSFVYSQRQENKCRLCSIQKLDYGVEGQSFKAMTSHAPPLMTNTEQSDLICSRVCHLCCTGVFAVVTGLAAAVLELQLRVGAGTGVGALLQYHRRPTGVSVEQQQGLIVAFDTARHHVLPLRADLGVQQGNAHTSRHT